MSSLINQEIYKLCHKKTVQFTPLVLFLAMLVVGIITKNGSDNRFYIEAGYAGFQWITIILIIECASMVAMEFQYGTIKHLIYESNNRMKIYLSKLLTMFLYDVLLHIFTLVFTIVIKYLTVGTNVSFSQNYLYHASLFQNLFTNTLVDFLGSLIIVSSVFMMASLMNSSAIAIAVGIGFIFIGEGLSSALISALIKKIPLIKWNPFNMLNIANQWSNPDYFSTTHLTQTQLINGNILYTLIFIVMSFLFFRKKRV